MAASGSEAVGVELHAVGLDPHDGAGVGGKQDVGYLREHRIGEVLDHQHHAVGPSPAEGQKRAGLGLAGLQRDPCPAQRAAQPDQPPVVRALVHEQGLARETACTSMRWASRS